MFIYFSENEPEISSEHLKLQSGARYSWKEGNDLTCCAKAWRFYYGISEWQHKRRSLKKFCKVLTQRFGKKHFNRRERKMIEWLKTYSSSVGCKLPFSEHAAPSPVIRLAFPNKILVHKVYKKNLRASRNVLKPLDFPCFTSVWLHSPKLSHIKCSKYKPGFSKCDKCKEYETNKLKKLTPSELHTLDKNFLKHVEEFMSEKKSILCG